jgi:outer membrane protein assembly factor BamB
MIAPTLPRLFSLAVAAGLLLATSPTILAQAASAAAPSPTQAPRPPRDGRLPKLPAAITSFGAAVLDDWLYVYGGHIGKAHAHSRDNLADGFWRLNLKQPEAWENLPMREKLQGFTMLAWRDSLIRIGGLSMRNAAGEAADMHSTAVVERFDPARNEWSALTPLPEPRSSFDAAIIGDRLYVIGGWALSGSDKTGQWGPKNYVADLTKQPLTWEPLPDAPCQHRALAVAAADGKIVAIGGLDSAGESQRSVHVFDPAAGTWKKGPELPGDDGLKGFGVSAFGVGDRIWASAADGRVHSLKPGEAAWRDAHFTLATPRFFHRILPTARGTLLFIGGAGKGGHFDTIEQVELATLEAPPVTSLPAPALPPSASAAGQVNWTGFRGDGDSHTTARNLPLQWSDTENVAWNAQLVGTGQSSPVVWGGKVFVTSVEGERKETCVVQCHSLDDGRQLWVHRFESAQPLALTDYISKAAPTPIVDAERVYAFFESGDLVALDHTGNVVWQRGLGREFGAPKGNHGLGASLAQTSIAIVTLVDHDGPSYLLSIDKQTGRDLWKVDRPARVSWSTPLVVTRGDTQEIVVSSAGSVEAYAASDGRQLWSVGDLKGNTVPSPSSAGDLILIGSSERDYSLALRERNGSAAVAWKAKQASASFGSPLAAGDSAYFVNRAGVAFCTDLASGEQRWSLRLPDSCWASPVAAGDLVYFFSKNGATTVLRNGVSGPEKIAESKLTVSDRVYGVAAVDGAWLVRAGNRLVCVRESKKL